MSILFFFIIYIFFIANTQQAAVCDETRLITEIRQDLKDNGRLDCERYVNMPHNILKSQEEHNKLVAGQWDSYCAFESDTDWMEQIKTSLKIPHLVDSDGNIVEKDFDDQADMCEIVRAGIAAGRFSLYKELHDIPLTIANNIDCPGEMSQTEICAVNTYSYFDKQKWWIAFTADAFKFEDPEGDKLVQKLKEQEKKEHDQEEKVRMQELKEEPQPPPKSPPPVLEDLSKLKPQDKTKRMINIIQFALAKALSSR